MDVLLLWDGYMIQVWWGIVYFFFFTMEKKQGKVAKRKLFIIMRNCKIDH